MKIAGTTCAYRLNRLDKRDKIVKKRTHITPRRADTEVFMFIMNVGVYKSPIMDFWTCVYFGGARGWGDRHPEHTECYI